MKQWTLKFNDKTEIGEVYSHGKYYSSDSTFVDVIDLNEHNAILAAERERSKAKDLQIVWLKEQRNLAYSGMVGCGKITEEEVKKQVKKDDEFLKHAIADYEKETK